VAGELIKGGAGELMEGGGAGELNKGGDAGTLPLGLKQVWLAH
jgi:hypothetical protein